MLAQAAPAAGVEQAPEGVAKLSLTELFAWAEAARSRGDARMAEAAYRALAGDADLRIRSEARFRLGMMYGGLSRHSEAAILFRQILDD